MAIRTPRLFRLAEDQAVINRMGFNNGGQPAALERLQSVAAASGSIGVNVGANKDSADRIADYVSGVRDDGARGAIISRSTSARRIRPACAGCRIEGALEELLGAVQEAGLEEADLPQGRA